jgi:DNA polymerase elongation subunit (family B)
LGNNYFKYFDLRLAEGITMSGQLSIRWMANKLNAMMNKTLKTVDKDYVIAIDTDSIYLSLEKLVDSVCNGKSAEQKIQYMDKICEEVFQPFINKGYQELADYMYAYSQKMVMKRESLADKGIFIAKKRYILNVHNSEGVQYKEPKLKVMGLEMVRSSTPAVCRSKLKGAIPVILDGDSVGLKQYVSEFKDQFMKLPVHDIAKPSGVNGMTTYKGADNIYAKGTPIHTRGALLFNHHTKRLGLDKKYEMIQDEDKIKFVYVRKPNPFQEDIISFPTHLPKEFGLDSYIDRDLQFQKVFVDALQIMVNPLGWSLDDSANLEDFFG